MTPSGYQFDQLTIGMTAELERTVTESDIAQFAAATGDDNPMHLDAAFAERGPFKARIAHGLLVAGYLSALLGTKLPGPGALYVSQSLAFKRPVKIGDVVTARVGVSHLDPKSSHVTLACSCRVGGKLVLEGEAVVIPARLRD